MQRQLNIRIGDKDYPLVYSLKVFKSVSDNFKSPDGMIAAIEDTENALKAAEAQIFMLHQLITAGAELMELYGEKNPPRLTLSETRAYAQLIHLAQLANLIKSTVAVCSQTSIEAAPSKKKTRRTAPRFESYMWQALHIGLDYNTALTIPFGELLSYIGEEAIQNGAKEKIRNDDDDVIPDWD